MDSDKFEAFVLIVIGLITFFCVAAFIALPITAIIGIHYNTGNGSQVGYVSAVEKTGLIWKTGRAFIKPELESTQEDVYCVMDPEVYTALEQNSVAKKRVKVTHFTYLSAGITNCAGEDGIISAVEVIE